MMAAMAGPEAYGRHCPALSGPFGRAIEAGCIEVFVLDVPSMGLWPKVPVQIWVGGFLCPPSSLWRAGGDKKDAGIKDLQIPILRRFSCRTDPMALGMIPGLFFLIPSPKSLAIFFVLS